MRFERKKKVKFETLISGSLFFSGLTENDRAFLFNQLNISDAAKAVTEQLFAVMERDGYSLAQSIELVMTMSSGLFDYSEARHLLNFFPSTYERLVEVRRFEHFSQMFDIADEVNPRRLFENSFTSMNVLNDENDEDKLAVELGDLSIFLDANRVETQYSFAEAARTSGQVNLAEMESRLTHERERMDAAPSHGYEVYEISGMNRIMPEDNAATRLVFEAFTNAQAFNKAREMFLDFHRVTDIGMAFALGAALGVEPCMFVPQNNQIAVPVDSHSDISTRQTSADCLVAFLFADVIYLKGLGIDFELEPGGCLICHICRACAACTRKGQYTVR